MLTPRESAVTSHTDGDWTYTYDARYKDWRATNEKRGERTRLKRTLGAAQEDVKARRLQRLVGGEWIDKLDRRN